MTCTIRLARLSDAPRLPLIEQAAGELFRRLPDLAWLADGDNIPEPVHRARIPLNTTWVAETETGELVGFLSAEKAGSTLFIAELSVIPDWQRKGVGTALVAVATACARDNGLETVTLTTFADVAWNAPYYEKIGFLLIPEADLNDYLRAHLDCEARGGLPRERRCAMQKRV